jgi:hypothetical protein
LWTKSPMAELDLSHLTEGISNCDCYKSLALEKCGISSQQPEFTYCAGKGNLGNAGASRRESLSARMMRPKLLHSQQKKFGPELIQTYYMNFRRWALMPVF